LADRINENDKLGIFVSPNKAFRIPDNDKAPIIMVGPGTGIAPFRAFLEEREVRGATGENWLFFGDQTRASDFIYEEQLVALQKSGVLNRLDLAFSRDQKEKIYVQNKMREHSKDLYQWLENGGYFYVCGDATRMARDVDQALLEIVAEQRDISTDEATDYVDNLKREKRYLRDVY
jgi:sulfite reductase (NADPH) flavoprotein alpha-component